MPRKKTNVEEEMKPTKLSDLMKREQSWLSMNISSLSNMFSDPTFKKRSRVERKYLLKQVKAMEIYNKYLIKRIEMQEKIESNEQE